MQLERGRNKAIQKTAKNTMHFVPLDITTVITQVKLKKVGTMRYQQKPFAISCKVSAIDEWMAKANQLKEHEIKDSAGVTAEEALSIMKV
jgi:hypothetical protein